MDEQTGWSSLDDIISEAKKIQCVVVDYNGKKINIFFRDLTVEETDTKTVVALNDIDPANLAQRITAMDDYVFKMLEAANGHIDGTGQRWMMTKEKWNGMPNVFRNLVLARVTEKLTTVGRVF